MNLKPQKKPQEIKAFYESKLGFVVFNSIIHILNKTNINKMRLKLLKN